MPRATKPKRPDRKGRASTSTRGRRNGKSAVHRRRTAPPPSLVTGAVPYQPKMTKTQAREAIDRFAGERVPLAEYREQIKPLTREERELLLDQALLMLEQVFVHLPLKRAMYAVDPVQRLRLLKLNHERMDERAFQSAIVDIFVGVRDLHTNYVLPSGYRHKFAFLPFRIEEFYEGKVRKYIVSWVSPVNAERNLKVGVVVTHWNGSPTELAVLRNADREAGSNPEARRARGAEALTLRWFGMSLPPDEDWVTLTYTDGTRTHESRFDWEVIDASDRPELLTGMEDGGGTGEAAAGWGIDQKTALLQRARKALFDAPGMELEAEMAAYRASGRTERGGVGALGTGTAALPVPPRANVSLFPDVYSRFGSVETPSGRFGYVRLRTFAPASGDVNAAVGEFARILSTLPSAGLILDVRGNGGGYINFGERILQLLTPRTIVPEPFHFVTTPLTLAMARSNSWLGDWAAPIGQGIETGAGFSQGFPLTAPEACNDLGQVFQGPVVLITDALCYSTTDIFAAGFQDHGIGIILGVHNNTGAGGANAWDHRDVLQELFLPPKNPFVPLPKQAGMRVAVRRSTRVGQRSGVPLEDLGVVPDVPHFLTRNDVLKHNVDLIAHAAQILAEMPTQTLRLEAVGAPVQTIGVEVENVDRVDLYVDGRPIVSRNVVPGTADISLPEAVPSGRLLLAHGYRDGDLVVSARRRI